MSMLPSNRVVMAHLASGVGNLVLATPLLVALDEMEFETDLRLDADYPPAAELFEGWTAVRRIGSGPPRGMGQYAAVLPASPPFYWGRFASEYRGVRQCVPRPPEALFYQDEQAWYLEFARALGYPADRRPQCRLPVAPSERFGVTARTVVLAPGSKTGEMAAKRWPYFPELAARLEDVAIVGTRDDLPVRPFPGHCRWFVDRLSLRETAELMASAGLVVGNDCGLAHVAAAAGTPTLMIFGPTDERVLGALPGHVRVLRRGLPCEPCWSRQRLAECGGAIDCLAGIEVGRVEEAVREMAPGISISPKLRKDSCNDRLKSTSFV
jgi:Glycosyltransferase family 9 (heptosyltransferase)